MPSWVTSTRVCLSLIVGACLGLAACSSGSGQRDINYGTDVAVGFIPPDGAGVSDTPPDGSSLDADNTGAAVDASDAPDGPDGGAGLDVAADEGD